MDNLGRESLDIGPWLLIHLSSFCDCQIAGLQILFGVRPFCMVKARYHLGLLAPSTHPAAYPFATLVRTAISLSITNG